MEVNVSKGTSVLVVAEHDEKQVRVGLPALTPEMLGGTVGHHELLPMAAQGRRA